jgi:hypothetical protein
MKTNIDRVKGNFTPAQGLDLKEFSVHIKVFLYGTVPAE